MINFNPLQSAFEAKIVFLEFKALRAHKKTISRFISTKGLFVDVRKERKIDSFTSATKFKFCLFLSGICS